VCSSAHARWWNGEWSIRKKITLDTTSKDSGIANPIGTAVVLIRLHDGNFQFAGAKDDGSDLRFVAADDKTLLTYHIEKYDSLLSEAFVWVKVPDVKAGTQTSFWLYYVTAIARLRRLKTRKQPTIRTRFSPIISRNTVCRPMILRHSATMRRTPASPLMVQWSARGFAWTDIAGLQFLGRLLLAGKMARHLPGGLGSNLLRCSQMQ